jgi:WD40 repeat protein
MLCAAAAAQAPTPAPALQIKQGPKMHAENAGDPLPKGLLFRLGSTRLRHWMAWRLRFSADGKELISAGETDECLVWDVVTGKLLRTMPRDAFPAAVSADGRWSVSLDKEGASVREWSSGKLLRRLAVANLEQVTFAKDGKTLAGLTRDNVVHRWDLTNGKEVSRHKFALAPRVYAGEPPARFSPDGTTLVGILKEDAAAKKETVPLRFWDVATGKESRPSLPVSRGVYDWRWTPDGKQLVVLVLPYGAELWDLTDGKKVATKALVGDVEIMELTPDGKGLLRGLFGGLGLRDLPSGKPVWGRRVAPFASGPGLKYSTVIAFAFSPVGKTMAVACSCGHIALLDWTTGEGVGFSRQRPGLYSGPVAFSPDSSLMLVHDAMTLGLAVHDARIGKEVFRHGTEPRYCGFTADGHLVVVRVWKDEEYKLQVVEPRTGREIWSLVAAPFEVWHSGDGKLLAFWDDKLQGYRFIDAATGNPLREMRLPPEAKANGVRFLELSPDFQHVAVRGETGKDLQLWNTTGEHLWTWTVPQGWGAHWDVRFLPGGKRLAVDCHSVPEPTENLCILDVVSGKKLYGMKAERRPWQTATRDGRYFVLAAEQKIEIREVITGQRVLDLEGGGFRGCHCAISAAGNILACNVSDYAVEIRELPSGKLLQKHHRPWYFVTDIAIAPDNRTVAISYNDSTIWVWDARAELDVKAPELRRQ